MTEAAELDEDEKLRPIANLCDGAVTRRTDGWRDVIHMPKLKFMVRGVEHSMDALLCLNHDNQSYPTKLYLEQNVGAGLNWNETAQILGRNWHTFSWSGVGREQSPFQILAAHLAALK